MIQKIRSLLKLDPVETKSDSWSDPNWASSGGHRVGGMGTVTLNDSVWTLSALQDISVTLSSLPFVLKDRDGNTMESGRVSPDVQAWLDLFENPNPLIEPVQLWELTSMKYDIDGVCFWVLYDSEGKIIQNQFDVPSTIIVADYSTVKPRYNSDNTILIGWWYQPTNSGTRVALEFFQVMRFAKTNPWSVVHGLKITDVVGSSIGLSKSAREMNARYFENGGRSDGHLEVDKDVNHSNDDIREWRDQWDQDYAGIQNAYKTRVLANGFSYKQDTDKIKDMDFPNLQTTTREDQLGGTRVPKHHLSLTDGVNHATADIADRVFWTNIILPRCTYIASVINSKMLLGSGLVGSFDTSGVYILKKDLNDKLDAAKKLWQLGYPINEINVVLDLHMSEVPAAWGNQYNDPKETMTKGNSKEPTSSSSSTTPEKSTSGGADTSPFDELHSKIACAVSDVLKASSDPMSLEDMLSGSKTGERKAIDALVDDIEAEVIDPIIPAFEKSMTSYFKRLRKSQIARLNAFWSGGDFETKEDRELTYADIDRVLWDKGKWDTVIQNTSEPYSSRAYKASLKRVEKELDGFVTFNPTAPEIAQEIKRNNAGITVINENLRVRMRAQMAVALEDGLSHQATRDAVEEVFDGPLSRVNTIARTETGTASNAARYNAMSKELQTKRWIDAGDEAVRTNHQIYAAEGSKVMEYEYAPNLRYPQQRGAAAAEVINCRCTLIAGD